MKVLVIRLGALGDLLHLSGALDAVKAERPEAEIHLVTSPAYQVLVEALPIVSRVWCCDKRRGWGGLWQLTGELRRQGFDAVVNLHPSFKTWLLAQLIRPRRQATYHKQKLRQKGIDQRPLARRHAVADFYEPFRRLWHLPARHDLTPVLPAEPSSLPVAERRVGLIVGVGGKRANRAWLPEAYRELIVRLCEDPTVRLLLIGGPAEQALAEALLTGLPEDFPLPRVENHCGRHGILDTARLLAGCALVIGGDTGPLHLAAAVGAPIVAIYGPTSLKRTGPLGKQPMVSITPPDSLECWPCERSACPYEGEQHLACMTQIPVATVLEACHRVLQSQTPHRSGQGV